jgi:F5/8 type C domain-containing protein
MEVARSPRSPRSPRRTRRLGAVIALIAALVAGFTLVTSQGAMAADTLISQGKPASASSLEQDVFPASYAVDGNTATRWSSAFSDPQWIQIDLGASYTIGQVVLNWEAAYATGFQIQTSANGTSWTDAYSTTTGTGGVQTLAVSGTGRYVRMNGTARATPYGYSLFEFQVFGSPAGTTPTTPPPTGPTVPGGGSLGPNVLVFDPSMSTASIQAQLNTVFAQQETNQFGSQRYELMFKPGSYSGLTANIGFYTSIAGLGRNPDDVQLNSSNVTVDAGWFGGNATQNFWRSAENFSVTPPAGTAYERWAVAQAAPMRRLDVHTHLSLTPTGFGWASGGYIADTKIDGQLQPFSQQQWYTRNSQIQMNLNAVWNNVFSGVVGAPATSFPNPPITTLATTPISREKPYLYLDGANYAVWVPSLRTNSSGVSWPNTPGSSIPLTQFYVAHPGDSAATINQALAQGLNLLFTPGIYHVNQTINVTRANTVVMGLGYATIIPDGGVTPMSVADVDGVKVSSLLFDAGTTNSPNLLQIGAAGSSANHAANPTSVQDVFFRIGGAGPGSATNSLLVNSNNTLIDHIWAWRADHGAGVGWTANPAASGLIVNGNDVLALGLFVEHYQNYQVQWNGNGGRTIFFQNEMPYDPPTQAAWRTGTNGYAAYKVADSVTTHEAWGLGSYCYFNVNPSIVAARGFEAPNKSGVRFHSLLTVSLGGVGSITNVINTTGGVAAGTDTVPSYLASYP